MDEGTEVAVIRVRALDKYHAAELADAEMDVVKRKMGEKRLYVVNNEEMLSADAVDAIATSRFVRTTIGLDVEKPDRPELVKVDEDDKTTWFWSATARARNVVPVNAGVTGGEKVSDGWNVGVGEVRHTLPEKDANGYTKRDADGNIVYSRKENIHARKAALRQAVRNAKIRCLGDEELAMGIAKTKKLAEDPAVQEQIKAARKEMGHPEGGPSAAKSESSPPPSSPSPRSGGGGDDADYAVDSYEWGAPKDGKPIPTLGQAQWFSSPSRGERRMTRQEIQGKTRYDLMELRKEWEGDKA